MKALYLVGALAFLTPVPQLYAQSTEYEAWLQEQGKVYDTFRTEAQAAYLASLRKPWAKVDAEGITSSANEIQQKFSAIETPTGDVVESAAMPRDLVPVEPKERMPEQLAPSTSDIADEWEGAVAEFDISGLFSGIRDQYQEGYLDDLSLLYSVVDALDQQDGGSESVPIRTAVFLQELGFSASIFKTERQVILGVASDDDVYDLPRLWWNNRQWYLVGLDGQDLVIDGELFLPSVDAVEGRSFSFVPQPGIASVSESRFISFTWNDKAFEFSIEYDASWVSGLTSRPELAFHHALGVELSSTSKQSLEDELRPALDSLDHRDQIDFLLRFVQKGFSYGLDRIQFGKQRSLIAEEVFFYPYSDCEDRSSLLIQILSSLTGTEAVGLYYPGHVTVGLSIPPLPGDHVVSIEGRNYVMADPTYIGASVGMVMPDFASQHPELLRKQ